MLSKRQLVQHSLLAKEAVQTHLGVNGLIFTFSVKATRLGTVLFGSSLGFQGETFLHPY